MRIKFLITILLAVLFPSFVFADNWFPTGSPIDLTPVASSWGLKVPGIPGGAGCLQVDGSGVFSSVGFNCSSGGSSFGQTWEINGRGLLAPTTTIGTEVNASSIFGSNPGNLTPFHSLDILSRSSDTSNIVGGLGLTNDSGTLGSTIGTSLSVGSGPSAAALFTGAIRTGSFGLEDFIWAANPNKDNVHVTPSQEIMRLTSAGNLGISSTTPGTKLSVNGAGDFTGTVTAPILNATNTAATSTFSGGVTVANFNQTGTATSTLNRGITLASGCYAVLNTCIGLNNLPGTVSNSQLAHSTIVVNGTTLTLGDSADTITAASSTLLANSNTFSGVNRFTNAATTTYSGGIEAPLIGAAQFAATSSATSTFAGGFNVANINQTGTATSTYNWGITIANGCYALNNICNLNIRSAGNGIAFSNNALSLATINAGVLGSPANGSIPTSQATSTLYGGASTGGFVLQWSNTAGGLVLAATSSSSGTVTSVNNGSTGSTLTFSGGPVTTSGTINGEINLTHSNIWTALQISAAAGTTTFAGGIESPLMGAAQFAATSSTATSTFAGGLNVANINQTGTATSTYKWGITIANGCYAINNTCIGLGTLSGTVPIANGGTNATSQTTNGVNFFNGTSITSGSTLTFSGTTLANAGNIQASAGTSFIVQNAAANNSIDIFNNGASGAGTFDVDDFSGGLMKVVFNSAVFGIATTTPNWNLQVAGTRPSIAISDMNASANKKHWLFSSMGGFLYFGTANDSYATSSTAIITVTNAGSIGIATSTPVGIFSVVGNSSPPLVIATSTATGSQGPIFEIAVNGHQITGGPTPSCGAGCSSVSGDDGNFRAITGVGVTAVTINFAATWKNISGASITPVCTSSDESGGTTVSDASSTPTSVTMNLSASLTTKMLAVRCTASNNFTF